MGNFPPGFLARTLLAWGLIDKDKQILFYTEFYVFLGSIDVIKSLLKESDQKKLAKLKHHQNLMLWSDIFDGI